MITWMQKHRKYLVVTIWVSTIAFVGAGFVGWGAYSFGSSAGGVVAKVGNEKIKFKELQTAYSSLYSYYNNLSNGQLTKEKADEMGLEQIVLSSLIGNALFINYAKELGITVLDDDIKKALEEDKNFQKDNVFNKEQYYLVLRNRGISAKEYEESLNNQILINKLNEILHLPPNDKEIKMLASAFFAMKDKIKIKVIYANDGDLNLTEDSLKTIWEKEKNEYLTKTSYKVSTIFVPSEVSVVEEKDLKAFYEENKLKYKDKEDKIKDYELAKEDVIKDFSLKQTKRKALEVRQDFKKDKIKAEKTFSVEVDDDNYPIEDIRKAKLGSILKPIEQDNGYLIIKVEAKIPPKAMDFEMAKPFVKEKVSNKQLKTVLEKQAKEELEKFEDGIDIGYVTRSDIKAVEGLTKDEFGALLSQMFDNKDKKSYVLFKNKAVIYEILEQKLLDNKKFEEYKTVLSGELEGLKNSEVRQNLLNELKKKYSIEVFMKGS